jgi:putative ABC transport system permease protein
LDFGLDIRKTRHRWNRRAPGAILKSQIENRTFMNDFPFAVGQLLEHPGFTAVAVLTLALGIGANTTVFSLCDKFLLQPLPYPDAHRLFQIWRMDPNHGRIPFAPADYIDFREQSRTFEQLAAYEYADVTLTGDELPERLSGLRVSGNFFQTAKVQALLGRTLMPEDGQPGKGEVVVLSHALWQRRFAGDANVLGRNFRIEGRPATVVGVLPERFDCFLQFRRIDVWRPLVLEAADLLDRSNARLDVLGRLGLGVTRQQATAELNTVAERLAAQQPGTSRGSRVEIIPLRKAATGSPEPLLLLMGAVAALLLIVCVNLASVLLARATGRSRELALRAAIGASRGRLLRQLLVESLLLACLGGLAGLLFAICALHVIGASIYIEGGSAAMFSESGHQVVIKLNHWGLGFIGALSLLTGIVSGLVPAVRASKTDLNQSLREGTRGLTGGRQHQYLRRVFAGVQVALAVVLLVVGGIFLQGLLQLESLQPGFESSQRLVARISLPESKYPDASRWTAFFQQLIEHVEALPGVERASVATGIPSKGGIGSRKLLAEPRSSAASEEPVQAHYDVVGPHYFQALGIPLRRGRQFAETDLPQVEPVAIINESLAARLWPDGDPIGRRIAQVGDQRGRWLTVVGVVRDVRYPGNFVQPESAPHIYLPHTQEPWSWMTLIVRCTHDPAPLAGVLRRVVLALDPDLPLVRIETLEQAIAHERNNFRVLVSLLGAFAGIGLLLALLGVYGVVAYDVAQRTHELGIRAALGAQRGQLLRLVTRQGMLPVGIGLAIGSAGAWAVARFLGSLLPSLAPAAPAVVTSMTAVLAVAAWLACVIPARRATRIDPMEALRCE